MRNRLTRGQRSAALTVNAARRAVGRSGRISGT